MEIITGLNEVKTVELVNLSGIGPAFLFQSNTGYAHFHGSFWKHHQEADKLQQRGENIHQKCITSRELGTDSIKEKVN
ncbi:uncharacterized protein LOC108819172 isoform X2 [Raphanus sativus]|uniref:Uncharacterized protein LOC108819172 isoform X2 n=1 Tax=Raphanus sativus TaxID=3726 RepID=A0A6J0KJ84_RAPSA|nr:uncharacterized protein LOC108819172 isoform X2 [Raphanus sativus]